MGDLWNPEALASLLGAFAADGSQSVTCGVLSCSMARGSGGARPEGNRIAPGRAFESRVELAAETTAGADQETTEATRKDETGSLLSRHDGLTAHLGDTPELRFPEPDQLGGDPRVHHVRTLPSMAAKVEIF
jgi:hypothetical protein